MDRDANPEPPDRDEHDEREDSPPQLSRPRRTTRPPNNYAREQEIDNEQTKARSQQRQRIQNKPGTQCDAAISDESATESDDPSAAKKLRQEIRRPDDLVTKKRAPEYLKRIPESQGRIWCHPRRIRHELQTLTHGIESA
ncbi:hypothetical protein N7509_008226 [Penicillium cosmopolitanum]|uniref:Uncharacterized protein n=1 Tax=Penicillium cosmopolitanum TaxID=1131564 RepID=A0A9X0B2F0_9EURO|nr:uncharacterized protein N7509_008226 [Penicillium cosmopolitanum]KAJ5385685.1 hypothetical protein N7509_008226 [Penicillium cosmopolitanum]